MKAEVDVTVRCPGCSVLMLRGGIGQRLRHAMHYQCLNPRCKHFGLTFEATNRPTVDLIPAKIQEDI
jgi:hypothetical protein